MWVRGLKLLVALLYSRRFMSHPMWVRGLKLLLLAGVRMLSMSHPMWVRGLKQIESGLNWDVLQVAPYVGAWIETD